MIVSTSMWCCTYCRHANDRRLITSWNISGVCTISRHDDRVRLVRASWIILGMCTIPRRDDWVRLVPSNECRYLWLCMRQRLEISTQSVVALICFALLYLIVVSWFSEKEVPWNMYTRGAITTAQTNIPKWHRSGARLSCLYTDNCGAIPFSDATS